MNQFCINKLRLENRALREKVRRLEKEVRIWKASSEEYAIQFHALHHEFIESNPNSFTNRFFSPEAVMTVEEWLEVAKEAGK